mmetsp:Transcript_7272/g.20146  ORF Transcript_7272/g.20146 Transcript_7272/m.20146 type:complete len:105 (-) Transcript_7272:141-455(-)
MGAVGPKLIRGNVNSHWILAIRRAMMGCKLSRAMSVRTRFREAQHAPQPLTAQLPPLTASKRGKTRIITTSTFAWDARWKQQTLLMAKGVLRSSGSVVNVGAGG